MSICLSNVGVGPLTSFQGGRYMLRRTLLRAFPFLAVGSLLLVAHFNFPGASVRAKDVCQLTIDAPDRLEDNASVAAPILSDFVGIYALVDKVVLEPNDTAPERVQLWGAFATASAVDRNNYDPPQRGYYYYSIAQGKVEICRREWTDFKAIAGTGQVIGFGSRDGQKGRLRKANEKAEGPDPYPVAWGLTRMSQRASAYPPIRELRSIPAAQSPAEGGEVKSGKVTLIAGNIADAERKNAKYIFEIRAGGSAELETSPPIAAGEKETRWSPNLMVKAGEKYTWRVKATDGQWTGPVVSSEFKGVR